MWVKEGRNGWVGYWEGLSNSNQVLDGEQVFPAVRNAWRSCQHPSQGILRNQFSNTCPERHRHRQSSPRQTHCSAAAHTIFLLPYFCEISFSSTMNITERFCWESKGCQVPLAVSIISCFPSPSCVLPGGCSSRGPALLQQLHCCLSSVCFSTGASSEGLEGPCDPSAPQPVPAPAHTDIPWGEQHRKPPGATSGPGSHPSHPSACVSLVGLKISAFW